MATILARDEQDNNPVGSVNFVDGVVTFGKGESPLVRVEERKSAGKRYWWMTFECGQSARVNAGPMRSLDLFLTDQQAAQEIADRMKKMDPAARRQRTRSQMEDERIKNAHSFYATTIAHQQRVMQQQKARRLANKKREEIKARKAELDEMGWTEIRQFAVDDHGIKAWFGVKRADLTFEILSHEYSAKMVASALAS